MERLTGSWRHWPGGRKPGQEKYRARLSAVACGQGQGKEEVCSPSNVPQLTEHALENSTPKMSYSTGEQQKVQGATQEQMGGFPKYLLLLF